MAFLQGVRSFVYTRIVSEKVVGGSGTGLHTVDVSHTGHRVLEMATKPFLPDGNPKSETDGNDCERG